MSQLNQQQLREIFDSNFKFKVGDLVIDKNAFEAYKLGAEVFGKLSGYSSREQRPTFTPSVVLERKLVQCHGGVAQGFYAIRRHITGPNGITQEAYESRIEEELMAFGDQRALLQAVKPEDDKNK